jgi:hypothetical protein
MTLFTKVLALQATSLSKAVRIRSALHDVPEQGSYAIDVRKRKRRIQRMFPRAIFSEALDHS